MFYRTAGPDIGTVFTTFVNSTSATTAVASVRCLPLYVALIGLLNAQYTLTGYDASAHMSEETHDAATSAPRGIVFSVVVSVIMGFILLVAMNIGITPDKVFPAPTGRRTAPPATSTRSIRTPTLSNAGPPITVWIDAVGQTVISEPRSRAWRTNRARAGSRLRRSPRQAPGTRCRGDADV